MRTVKTHRSKIHGTGGARHKPPVYHWWMLTARRRKAKADAQRMALEHIGGDESKFIAGDGLYKAVRAIFPAWRKLYSDIAREYNIDTGNELKCEILQNRVDKMYSEYRPDKGVKGRKISGEHPDNSPSYRAPS